MFKRILTAISMAIIAGCASQSYVTTVNPIVYYTADASATASITGFCIEKIIDYDRCLVVSEIDGWWIQSPSPDKARDSIQISAGPRDVQVMLFRGDRASGKTRLSFEAQAERSYSLRFKEAPVPILSGNIEAIWVEDTSTGERVSENASIHLPMISTERLSRVDEETKQARDACMDENYRRTQQALDACNRVISAAPRGSMAPYLHTRRSELLRRQKNYDAAIAEAGKALSIKPDYFPALINRCSIKRWYQDSIEASKRDYSSAMDDCMKAIEMEPDDFFANNMMGQLHKSMGKWEAALAYFDKAEKLGPGWALPNFNRGNLYMRRGDYENAIKELKIADRKSDILDIDRMYALALSCAGKNVEAVKEYDKTLEKEPEHPFALMGRAYARSALADKNNAMRDAELAKKIDSSIETEFLEVCGGKTPKL